MAQPWVAGPGHIFVGLGGFSVPVGADSTAGTANLPGSAHYLGTAEHTPRITLVPQYVPGFSSALGRLVQWNSFFAGEHAFIFADLTRWNEDVYQLAATRPLHVSGDPGSWDEEDVGVMTADDPRLEVVVLLPYATKPQYRGMPKGYRFLQCESMGPDDLYSLGINPRKTHVMFHAFPKLEKGKWITYKLL